MKRCLILLVIGLLAGCARFQPVPLSPAKSAAAFDARSLTDTNLLAFVAANRPAAGGKSPVWDLEALTLVGFYYQPALAEARAQWALARAGQTTAGERPNPSVTFTPEYDSTTPPPWILGGTWDIPIETAGKRGRRLDQARHLTEAARWNLVGTMWQTRSAVRTALLDLYAARETESQLAAQAGAQSNVVRLLEGQLAAGSVAAFDVTQARIALVNVQLTIQDARRQRLEARGKLADALGLPVRSLDGVALDFSCFSSVPAAVPATHVRRQAALHRADIRAALAEYAACESALQLEIARQYPDIHLSPGYQLDQTDNKWSLGVTVTLPILNQNQGPIAEAEAKRKAAAAHFLAVQARAMGEIDRALAGYRAAREQTAGADALVQELQTRMASVRARQRAGELEPLAAASAQTEFASGLLARLDARLKAQRALGQLEDASQSTFKLTPTMLEPASGQGKESAK
jgi:outer membrane protein TolC